MMERRIRISQALARAGDPFGVAGCPSNDLGRGVAFEIAGVFPSIDTVLV